VAKMGDQELLAILKDYEASAMGSSVAQGGVGLGGPKTSKLTTLEIDRYDALNYYYARPFGNEQQDRSQIVIPELRDTVEWILPQLMRVFLATDKACKFEPEGADDENLADQESDVVNHVFMQLNDGWTILHDYIKDALILRNGYIKTYYEKARKSKIENYTGLSEDEVGLLMQPEDDNEKLEIVSQREYPFPGWVAPPPMPMMPGQPPQPTPTAPMLYDIKLRRITNGGHVVITAVPPEEMLVSPRTSGSLDKSPFYAHRVRKPRSELIQDEYDEDDVMALEPGAPRWTEIIQLARDSVLDEQTTEETSDKSMVEVEIHECIVRVDFDGDGVAELRRIVVGGSNTKILENEEIEEGCIVSGVPSRMPHRHIGFSLYDLLADLQLIKSTLIRQSLDNIYLANNTRTAIDYNKVNADDLLTNRPGGVVRSDGPPSESIMPLESNNILSDMMPMIAYVDSLREMRTGVGKDTVGMDPEALQNVTKGGQLAGMAAAGLKIEMIARLLAEGIKDMFRKIHNELIRHQDEPMTVKLRGKWVTVDPRSWHTRNHVVINVGLGSGNNEEKRVNLSVISQMMKDAMAIGISGPQQAFNLAKDTVQLLLGTAAAGEYFVDPASPEGQQLSQQIAKMHGPPPALQVAQIRAQSTLQAAQLKAQTDAQAAQMDHQLQMQRLGAQSQSDTQQNVLEAKISALKNQLDIARQQQKDGGQLELAQNKALLGFVADIASAALKAGSQPQAIQSDIRATEQAVNQ